MRKLNKSTHTKRYLSCDLSPEQSIIRHSCPIQHKVNRKQENAKSVFAHYVMQLQYMIKGLHRSYRMFNIPKRRRVSKIECRLSSNEVFGFDTCSRKWVNKRGRRVVCICVLLCVWAVINKRGFVMAMCWILTGRAGKTQINTAKCRSILATLLCV